MVKKVSQLGVTGNQGHIRIFTTSSPVPKAEGIFNSLTKHAVSKVTQSNGTIVAHMGNGNFITFRTVSKSGYPATIDLNFPAIFGNTPKVIKFATP